MRLDQRGFDDAHLLLHNVHLYQHGYLSRHGRFAANRQALDPTGDLLGRYDGELEIRVSEDGAAYWACVRTPPDVVFGLAAQDDDYNNYWVYFADDEEPRGGVGDDDRWRHITDSADYPDW